MHKIPAIAVGDVFEVRGMTVRILKIRPFGTVDVETLDGKHWYRVTGLQFTIRKDSETWQKRTQ
jgi:hypothetical protein